MAKTTTKKTPAAKKPKAAAKPKTEKAPKATAAGEKPAPKIFNSEVDQENQALFIGVHLPAIKTLREKLNNANSNLRNAYKTAKAEGGFTKTDFDTAIALEDEEREAKAKAKIARQLVIARYMGKALGAQLDLFLEPDRTPSSDIAFEEGKQAALASKTAKPDYHPATEQHRRYMEGYHSVTADRVAGGIKKLEPATPAEAIEADQADKKATTAKTEAQKKADAAAFDDTPKGSVPTSRAQFLAQQQKESEPNADTVFTKRTQH